MRLKSESGSGTGGNKLTLHHSVHLHCVVHSPKGLEIDEINALIPQAGDGE